MTSIIPAIDDKFWFAESVKLVQSGIESRKKAAGVLESTIAWLWSIYTGATAIGLTFGDQSYSAAALTLLILPSPLLVLGYWLASNAQMPVPVEFDPRSPEDIQLAFEYGIKDQSRRLNYALSASAIGAIAVSIAFIAAASSSFRSEPNFQSNYFPGNTNPTITIFGTVSDAREVRIALSETNSEDEISKIGLTDSKGNFETLIEHKLRSSEYSISISWQDEHEQTHSITKFFSANTELQQPVTAEQAEPDSASPANN